MEDLVGACRWMGFMGPGTPRASSRNLPVSSSGLAGGASLKKHYLIQNIVLNGVNREMQDFNKGCLEIVR